MLTVEIHATSHVGRVRRGNEDNYLLAKLVSEVLATPHVVLYPGVPGDEDEFLIRADKNPNTRGAQDMGLPAPATATQLAAMAQAIDQGTIKVLYAIGVNLAAAFGHECSAYLTSGCNICVAEQEVA